MLRLASYDVVFQEVPGEVSLALNIAGCPNRCAGCHSPHLWEDKGEALDDDLLEALLEAYGGAVSCVCFMGGDAEPALVEALCRKVHARCKKTAWYSGRDALPAGVDLGAFDFVKIGAYMREAGGLKSPRTNQRFYKVEEGSLQDITATFWRDSAA